MLKKGLLQRTPDASVFLLLSAPSLLCGSSLFAAQAHKKHLFQKPEGEANSQITISFVTTLHSPSEKGCFTQAWTQAGGMQAWLSLKIYSLQIILLLVGTKTQNVLKQRHSSQGITKMLLRQWGAYASPRAEHAESIATQTTSSCSASFRSKVLAYCIFPRPCALKYNLQPQLREGCGVACTARPRGLCSFYSPRSLSSMTLGLKSWFSAWIQGLQSLIHVIESWPGSLWAE